MATKLGVYNGALFHLDTEALVSLTEEGKKRRALDTAYGDVVQSCLEAGLWNFAMRAVEMESTTSADTNWGYAYVFDKPDDWVRTAALTTDEYGKCPLLHYEDRADTILADVDIFYLWYVSNHDEYGLDLGKWPQSFADYFEYALAHKTCGVVTGGTEKKDTLYKKMVRAQRNAANKDAMNQPVTRFPPTGSLVGSRLGRGLGSREGRYRAG